MHLQVSSRPGNLAKTRSKQREHKKDACYDSCQWECKQITPREEQKRLVIKTMENFVNGDFKHFFMPISITYFDSLASNDSPEEWCHDIACIYSLDNKALLLFDSRGNDGVHQRNAVKHILRHLTGFFKTAGLDVSACEKVVKERWQEKNDILCVMDVWHFFAQFANMGKSVCEYYSEQENCQKRFDTLKSFYEQAP